VTATPAERTLCLFLRCTALFLLLALGAVVMPHAWMAATHAWLGLGDLPELPITGYLTRTLSGLYAYNGLLTWAMSNDVRRFAPLIRLQAVLTLLFGPGLLALDLAVGMPLWWAVGEAACLVAFGITQLWLQKRCADQAA